MKFITALVLWVALFTRGHTNSLDSCVGRCGYGTDSDFTCQCNPSCEKYGDCCSDYVQVCKSSSSCKNRCDETYNSQNECHCNSKCSQYNNCCEDYDQVCDVYVAGGGGGSVVSDADIKSISQVLFTLDSNKASASQLILEPQTLIPDSQTSAQTDHAPKPLFRYLDEGTLFSRPTYAALLAVLDNYRRMTGQTEAFTQQQLQEQEHFVRETMSNTEVGRELFAFLYTKGVYSSEEEFLQDLKMMWFGLYSRSNGQLDSSGFEHIFAGEVKGGKVSGFHNWIQFYLLEKRGQLNYYSHSFNGPWTSYPDVLGMQFNWDGYYKQVGSAVIGCSPEFDFALYSLCYITRPGKMCRLSLGGKELRIQTYTWDKTTYGDGKKYIGSAFPATP
uniref:Uridylate-specific endoribonuclease n=1 Tax=Periophthalmus magnuspinnatus TaxID=409849 RepID=A0A3B3ZVY6_9GOBI